MKKKYFFIVLSVTFICFFSISILAQKIHDNNTQEIIDSAKNAVNNKTVIAVVDGKEIYKEMIDFLATAEKISQEKTAAYSNKENSEISVDTEKILQEEIRKAVVLAEAERQGLSVSRDEAKEYTMGNYNAAKEENGDTYQLLLDYMEEMNLTEKEYLELCISSDQTKLTRAKLYEKFAEDKTGTYEEIVLEYDKYVESLISKANIEYK